jgi:hypothetical protein
MGAARAGRTAAHAEPASKLGLAGGGERSAFLMTHANPFNLAAAYRISKGIERVADQSKNMFDADLFEHADQSVRYGLGHLHLQLL